MITQPSSTTQASSQQSTLLQAYLMIEELEAQLDAVTARQQTPIAIVGMVVGFLVRLIQQPFGSFYATESMPFNPCRITVGM